MRLKYYLRGMGIGVVCTTLLFMILIAIHKNDGAGQGINMSPENKNVTTVGEATKAMEEAAAAAAETETAEPATEPDTRSGLSGQQEQDTDKTKPDKNTDKAAQDPDTDKAATNPDADKAAQNKDTDKTAADPDTDKAASIDPVENETPQPAEKPDTKPESAGQQEKVRIEISGGQYSDVVCRKLAEAGLVDDAKAFNDYLVKENYDNSILPGVYEIPKGSTYEEIAVLLTTKVR